MSSGQVDRAETLAEWLAVAGHEDLTSLDLLDALAGTGLRLTRDRDGVAAAAYWTQLGAPTP